jgi:pimeloyl-ACP methyl ester carboxylesterase|tara:strand:+ start:10849 stop:11154 length:306 start_codon:yes stop_codon:yes gene_type:complete
LTVHGSNQNEDGSYSWKFDNYTHVMSPFALTFEQTQTLWDRIESPILLISGSETWFGQGKRQGPARNFRNARHVTIKNAGHWGRHDQLEEFLRIARAFFSG